MDSMDILVRPNSSRDPAGLAHTGSPTPIPTAPAPHHARGAEPPLGTAHAGESQLAQAGPRTQLPLSPQDWKEKYIHENYTKALAGKMVEMVRPQRTL